MLYQCSVISVMNLVSELDLPVFDYTAPDFSADRYHQQLAETRQQGWLAKSPGTIVAVCAERANRQGEDGEGFDITASRDTRLLTFGAGTHFCPGANLARAELEEALAFLAPRTSGLALDGPPQLGGVEGIYGIDKLPIMWSGSSELNPSHGLAPDVS
jgi:hypothetical protein